MRPGNVRMASGAVLKRRRCSDKTMHEAHRWRGLNTRGQGYYCPGTACEVCGCTEDRACPGGCSWNFHFLAAGRHVCSRCTHRAKPIQVQEVL